jgi:hypothetical protein
VGKGDGFRFRKLDTIGSPDAEQDAFLSECFVDTGLMELLLDCKEPRRLIVGRTGSGKTALIKKLRDDQANVIAINPEQLATGYIVNSTILNFVLALGVKLDIFFRLLWRHVLAVELLKAHAALDSEDTSRKWVERVMDSLNSRKKKNRARALDYLTKYGASFWMDTESRVKEVTSKIERDLKAAVSSDKLPLTFSVEGARRLSTEQREEVVHRAQEVANRIQVQELAEMIGLIDELLDDPQRRFFILIDRLDEDWVDDRLRYLLIRALLETVREFHRVRHAKVVVALRLDLLERVFRHTRDGGFQEEKYEGEVVRLQWTRDELVAVLDRRVNHLVRRSYTKAPLSYADVLPKFVGKQPAIDYLLDRTLMRPRDVIQFFNYCIQEADGKPAITETALRTAEGEYSRSRLRALADEWQSDYPNLISIVMGVLKGRPAAFTLSSVTDAELAEYCLSTATAGEPEHPDRIYLDTMAVAEGRMDPFGFWMELVEMFYRVGILGLKLEPTQPTMWSMGARRSVSTAEIHPEARAFVHKCFWRVLGTNEREETTRDN